MILPENLVNWNEVFLRFCKPKDVSVYSTVSRFSKWKTSFFSKTLRKCFSLLDLVVSLI